MQPFKIYMCIKSLAGLWSRQERCMANSRHGMRRIGPDPWRRSNTTKENSRIRTREAKLYKSVSNVLKQYFGLLIFANVALSFFLHPFLTLKRCCRSLLAAGRLSVHSFCLLPGLFFRSFMIPRIFLTISQLI